MLLGNLVLMIIVEFYGNSGIGTPNDVLGFA